MLLTEKELRECREAEPGSRDAWADLELLVPHRNDHLVVVDSARYDGMGSCSLTVFVPRDSPWLSLYVLVTNEGEVRLGRTDQLGTHETRRLDDFDPLWHGVVSVAVTDRHRFVGVRSDLWIVVRRPADETVTYHGVVGLEDGHLVLEPSLDDRRAPEDRRWLPGDASRLPPWLRSWSFVVPAGADPFDPPPPAALAEIQGADTADIDVVVCSPCVLGIAAGGEVRLCQSGGREPRSFRTADWIRALTLSSDLPSRGVAGPDARLLVAFELGSREVGEVWRQPVQEFPVAVAFLPPDNPGLPPVWPDLLVAFHDGELQRIRHIGNDAFREAWEGGWKRLSLTTPEARIGTALWAIHHRENWDEERRRAALLGAVELVLAEVGAASPETRQDWLGGLLSLFQPDERSRVLLTAVYLLLREIQRLADGERDSWPLPGGGDFVAALLHQVYQARFYITVQDEIDQAFRVFRLTKKQLRDKDLKALHRRAKHNRAAVWTEPEPLTTDGLIRRDTFGIERWASAYLHADIALLGKTPDTKVVTGLAGLARRGDTAEGPWLVVGEGRSLHVYGFSKDGTLEPKAGGPFDLGDDSIRTLSHLPGPGSDRLLVAGTSGTLYLLAVDPGTASIGIVDRLTIESLGSPWALACCPAGSGEPAIAVSYNERRQSTLVFLTVAGDRLQEMARSQQPLPRVRTLDLAADGEGGFLLAAGAVHTSPVWIYRLDKKGEITEKRPFRVLKSGTLAVRFSALLRPDALLAGERNGLLWCADLAQSSNVSDLRWTYDLGGAVRAIEAVTLGGEPAFLAGAEHGRLVLLRARDGRRLWKHRLRAPVRMVRQVDLSRRGAVAVALSGGWVVSFDRVEDRVGVLATVRRDLETLERAAAPAWRESLNAAVEPVPALFRLVRHQESFLSVLRGMPVRESRARLVRYLVEEIGPDRLDSEIADVLHELTLREIQLLLSYLPDSVNSWDGAIGEELKRRPLRPQQGDDSRKAAMAAWVTYLQRLGRRSPGLVDLAPARPPSEYFEIPWVGIECARLLLQGAAAAERLRMDRPGRLLGAVLATLFEMPFSLTNACADVLQYDSPDATDFARLRTLTGDLLRSSGPRVEDVQGLADSLQASGATGGLLHLLSSLVEFFAIYLRAGDNNLWRDCRKPVLAALRRVAQRLLEIKRSDVSFGDLVTRLRQCLPPDLPPRDSDPLKERMSWLQQARQRLDQEDAPEPGESDNLWPQIGYKFISVLKVALVTVIRLETMFVFYLVRPYLKQREIELGEGRRLVLRLSAEPEGSRQLNDVSILFNAGGEDGLLPPGKCEERFDSLSYPEKTATKELLFTGFLRPDQEQVKVCVTMQDEGLYQFEETWSFPVPKSLDRVRHRLSFQDNLHRAFESFMDRVLAVKAPVVLVVLDGDLGRDAFLERWLARTRGRRVNLDEIIRDYGAGRRYSARSLDLELLTGIDGPAQGDAGDLAERPVLVAPVDEVLQRLLDGEAKGLLAAWLSWLRQRAAARQMPRYVIAVSSAHACELRALGLGEIAEVAAHRVFLEELGPTRRSSSPLLKELVEVVSHELSLELDAALDRIEKLGFDLRLVMRWLRWSREDVGRAALSVSTFLAEPQTRRLLMHELRALEPYELINALVGAEAVTVLDLLQVQPGHWAASDYLSTTRRSSPKLLQQQGTSFTERTLTSLRSDLQPPNKVRIEGVGVLGTIESLTRSGLLGLATHFRREQREVVLRRLEERGIGSYIAPVFRTTSPYRELIRSLYDSTAGKIEAKRDTDVYGAIKGRDRSPLEGLSLVEISRMPRPGLRTLLPDTKNEDLRRLQRIGRLWDLQSGEALDNAVSSLFQPEPVSLLSPKEAKYLWYGPVARLRWPVFGVGRSKEEGGETYPEEYYVWSGAEAPVDLRTVGEVADQASQLRQKTRRREAEDVTSARARDIKVTVFGPGADALAYDETRRVAVLRSFDFCQAAWEGDIVDGIRRRARSQMRMTALSPFQTSGALPPGSPLFVGREKELSFIKDRIRTASILIIGSRRVGKTSLLNQIDSWARSEPDLAPVFVDLQGCMSSQDFIQRLRSSVTSQLTDSTGESLEAIVSAIRKTGRLPVLLLNEIDGLVQRARSFVSSWRGLNDRQQARFLMVGYSAIGTLGDPKSPFFHFTEGPELAGKAMVLTALSQGAAEKLLDLLETTELQIHWTSKEDRDKAYRLCLDRSYRIPWVLQRYGQLLVEHLEKERRDTLTYQDVERVVERQGQVVWNYIDGIDYKSLGGGVSNAQRPGFQLVLAAVARRKYFLGVKDAFIHDPRLPDRPGLDKNLGFTVGEAREIIKDTLHQLLTERREREAVERWFDALDLEQALRLLTLTLMLEPDPEQDGRFGFLLHILPRELLRIRGKNDPTLDSLIVDYAVEFMRFMDKDEESSDGRSRPLD